MRAPDDPSDAAAVASIDAVETLIDEAEPALLEAIEAELACEHRDLADSALDDPETRARAEFVVETLSRLQASKRAAPALWRRWRAFRLRRALARG